MYNIDNEESMRQMIGKTNPMASKKIYRHLNERMQNFIHKSLSAFRLLNEKDSGAKKIFQHIITLKQGTVRVNWLEAGIATL